jgi:hypothetical protein
VSLIKQEKLIIISREARLHRHTNESCIDAGNIYNKLKEMIGCTYLIYMHENLKTNEKFVYSSSWNWQDLLIGEKLINHCPIFLAAFNYLEKRDKGSIFLPWHMSPPANREQRNVCGIRSEFNIAHGFGYGAKGNGIRESLAFGGDAKDSSFYKHFIEKPEIFNQTLNSMRLSVIMRNYNQGLIEKSNKKLS